MTNIPTRCLYYCYINLHDEFSISTIKKKKFLSEFDVLFDLSAKDRGIHTVMVVCTPAEMRG